jgi:hypothetical protein
VPGEAVDKDSNIVRKRDICLSNVIVSNPEGTYSGVVQFDLAKAKLINSKNIFERKGFLNSLPTPVRTARAKLQARHKRKGSKVSAIIA